MNSNLKLENRVIFFTGYPGSGKGTQAHKLSATLDIVHLSTGELFRKEAKTGSEIGKQMARYMELGQIIPQELTFEYLETELSKPKYRKGFILDGYPKDLECCRFIIRLLKKLQFIPELAIHFSLPRQEVEDRLTGRLHCKNCELDYHLTKVPPRKPGVCDVCEGSLEARLDDTIESIRKRLDVFEQKTQPVLDEFKKLHIYHQVDADASPRMVSQELISLIARQLEAEREHPYFLRPPSLEEVDNSQVFHNHIDAESEDVLREIVEQIEYGEPTFCNKIYPIYQLELGPQIHDPQFAHLYQNLPNFHPIDPNRHREAFATGKMGSAFNYGQIRKTLAVCQLYRGRGVMTELEQEIFSSEEENHLVRSEESNERERATLLAEVKKELGESCFSLATIPKFELHHGFDIPKKAGDVNPPIEPSVICSLSTKIGFSVGGWFIFRKSNTWAYRSNEFYNGSYEDAMSKLKTQADSLNQVLNELSDLNPFHSGYSLENVIAIWRF